MRSLLLVSVVGSLALTGCASEPLYVHQTNNPNIDVELLFEHDGCRIYRFRDGAPMHYFARCDGPPGAVTASTSSHVSKREELIVTQP
jgi:hypothetical protein